MHLSKIKCFHRKQKGLEIFGQNLGFPTKTGRAKRVDTKQSLRSGNQVSSTYLKTTRTRRKIGWSKEYLSYEFQPNVKCCELFQKKNRLQISYTIVSKSQKCIAQRIAPHSSLVPIDQTEKIFKFWSILTNLWPFLFCQGFSEIINSAFQDILNRDVAREDQEGPPSPLRNLANQLTIHYFGLQQF